MNKLLKEAYALADAMLAAQHKRLERVPNSRDVEIVCVASLIVAARHLAFQAKTRRRLNRLIEDHVLTFDAHCRVAFDDLRKHKSETTI